MAISNITRFYVFVILSAGAAFSAYGIDDTPKPVHFGFFLGTRASVQTAFAAQAPALPQLRRAVEAGFFFALNDRLRTAFTFETFLTDASIPAGAILHRGYSGFSVEAALDYSFLGTNGLRTAPFVSASAGASLARYSETDLVFMAYTAIIAPGIVSTRGGFDFRASLPLSLEFRGDATAVSAGLRFVLSFARNPPRRDAR